MKSASLSTPFLDSERYVRSVNFFNGRLLTAEDMKKEQQAEALHRQRLGRVLGEGVVQGLRVSIKAGPTPRAVEVEPGVAINALGEAIELPEKIEIPLQQDASSSRSSGGPALLSECSPPEQGVYVAGKGLYLLTIGPGEGVEGSVQVTGLSNPILGSRKPCCGARHRVEGATFRLTELNNRFTAAELNAEPKLRSVLARRCFVPEKALSFVSDPFGATDPNVDSPLQRLGLAADERLKTSVPLAVLHWTAAGGLGFADNWCVRRRPSGRLPEKGWPVQTGEAREAEAEAMLWQFQDHLAALSGPSSVRALDVFTYLPPAGVLPVDRTEKVSGFPGFDVAKLFDGFAVRDFIYIEGARAQHLLRTALAYPPMDLATPGSRMVWVYRIRENGMSADADPPTGVRPHAVFTTGQVPYFGEARFDGARWDYASFV